MRSLEVREFQIICKKLKILQAAKKVARIHTFVLIIFVHVKKYLVREVLSMNLEEIMRLIIGILFVFMPGIGIPLVAIIVLVTTIADKNQIPIKDTYCELPKDKYEIVDEKKFNLMMKIRGYSFFLLIFLTLYLQVWSLIAMILAVLHMMIFNYMLEKYYKLRQV